MRAAFALVVAACGAPAAPRQQPPAPVSAAPSSDVVATYEHCWNLWNTRWDDLRACYDDAIVSEEPGSGSPPWRGKDAVMGHVRLFKQVFPDASGALQLVLVDGRHVVGVALVSGTHTGAMQQPTGEIAPTGRRLGLQIAHEQLLNDAGTSVTERIFIDHGALWGQLGLYPGPHRELVEHAQPKQVVVATHGANERRNLASYRRRVERENAHDARGVAAELGDAVVWSDPTLPADLDKRAALGFLETMWKGFSDLTVSAPEPWAAGDYVVSVGVMEGTNDHELPLVGQTDRHVTLPFLEISKFGAAGEVVAIWRFYDGLGLAAQLRG